VNTEGGADETDTTESDTLGDLAPGFPPAVCESHDSVEDSGGE
jgi:hypothetical protein